jgi:hypothetical protein
MYRTHPFAISLWGATALALAACGSEPDAGNEIDAADVVGDGDADLGRNDADSGEEDLAVDTGPDGLADLIGDTATDQRTDLTLGDDADVAFDASPDAHLDEDGGADAFSDVDVVADLVPDLPSCAVTECGEATCEEHEGVGAVCVCPQGYAFDTGTCALDLLDATDFAEERWFRVGDGDVSSDGAYLGTAELGCEPFGLETEVLLPEVRPDGTRLVLEVVYEGAECAADCEGEWDARTQLALGDRAFPVSRSIEPGRQTAAFCLGDHAFSSGSQTVSFGSGIDFDTDEPFVCGAVDSWIARIERIGIREAVANECPADYGVANGDFATGDLAGWVLEAAGDAPKRIVATTDGFALDIGFSGERCDSALLRQRIDVPGTDTTPSLALEGSLTYSGEAGDILSYYFGLRDGDRRNLGHSGDAPAGAPREFHTCLPAWAYGKVLSLELDVRHPRGTAGCSAEATSSVRVSDLDLVEDPACRRDGGIDDGFEDGLIHWWTQTNVGNSGVDTYPTVVAHDGEDGHFLRLAAPEVCSGAGVQALVPLAVGETANVSFRYRSFEDVPDHDYANVVGSEPLANASEWTEGAICVTGNDTYAAQQLVYIASGLAGFCAEPYSAYLELDDIVVDRDAACP